MICLVDMEHEQAVRRGAPCADPGANGHARHEAYCADLRRRLEETSGDACTIRPYPTVTRRWLNTAKPRALVLPEGYGETQPDGHRFLTNFFRAVSPSSRSPQAGYSSHSVEHNDSHD